MYFKIKLEIMKNIILIICSILFSLSYLHAQEATDGRDQFTVKVDGLGCPFCAYGLEKKFKEFEGIDDVKIEMETGIFTFSYPATDALTMEKVEAQVDAAGYTAVDVNVLRADGSTEMLAQNTTELTEESEIIEAEFFVAGNCGMCEARIVKAANGIEGVTEANWDKKTKLLMVKFDSSQTTQDDIEKTVAEVGHDTNNHKTSDATYDDLPGCCQYDRSNN